MKDKLLIGLNYLKSLALKLYSLAPCLTGVIIGYVFKPEINLILDAATAIVKGLLKL